MKRCFKVTFLILVKSDRTDAITRANPAIKKPHRQINRKTDTDG